MLSPRDLCVPWSVLTFPDQCYSLQLMRKTSRTQAAAGKLTTGSVAWTNRRAPNWARRKKRPWRRSWQTPVKCHCGETLWMSMASSSWLWLCSAMPTLHNFWSQSSNCAALFKQKWWFVDLHNEIHIVFSPSTFVKHQSDLLTDFVIIISTI